MATRCRTSGLLAVAAILTLAPPARAHVRLESPAPRYGDEMKSRPCGRPGGVRTTRVTTVRPGQTLTVIFDEFIDHPGYFRIAFDRTGDTALGPPVWNGAAFVNPSNVEILEDLIANPPGLTHGERRVQLPDIECDTCTLQLIQVMTDKPPFDGIDDFYYQCADLRLSATAPLGGPPPNSAPSVATTSEAGTQSGGCSSAGSSWIALGALLAARLARRRREGRAPAA
jgi:hypothetical protein